MYRLTIAALLSMTVGQADHHNQNKYPLQYSKPGTGTIRTSTTTHHITPNAVRTVPVAVNQQQRIGLAQPVTLLNLSQTSPGSYWLQVNQDGTVSLTPIVVVTPDGTGNPPPPGDKLATTVRNETAALPTYPNLDQHKMGMRLLYEALATGIQNGQITPALAKSRLGSLRPQLLGNDASKWQSWTSKVDPLTNTGNDYMTVATTLNDTSFEAALGDGQLLRKLLELIISGEGAQIIKFLLQLIELLG